MPLPTDPCQQLSEAIATIVDPHASIAALTGRASDNLVRWRRRKATALPRLAYLVGPTAIAGGLGETYDVDVVLRAEATTAAAANALLRAAVELLTPMAFEALGCDALVTDADYDNPPDDQGDPASDANAVAVEADLTVNLTL
jgi:hypothetical protein